MANEYSQSVIKTHKKYVKGSCFNLFITTLNKHLPKDTLPKISKFQLISWSENSVKTHCTVFTATGN